MFRRFLNTARRITRPQISGQGADSTFMGVLKVVVSDEKDVKVKILNVH